MISDTKCRQQIYVVYYSVNNKLAHQHNVSSSKYWHCYICERINKMTVYFTISRIRCHNRSRAFIHDVTPRNYLEISMYVYIYWTIKITCSSGDNKHFTHHCTNTNMYENALYRCWLIPEILVNLVPHHSKIYCSASYNDKLSMWSNDAHWLRTCKDTCNFVNKWYRIVLIVWMNNYHPNGGLLNGECQLLTVPGIVLWCLIIIVERHAISQNQP